MKKIILFFFYSFVIGQNTKPSEFWKQYDQNEKIAFINGAYGAVAKLKAHHKVEVHKQESSLSDNKQERIIALEKTLKLTIKVKIDSWFNMTIDNFREEDFILPAGEEKSFFGDETFRLTIGNNKGTELILNGKNLVIPKGKKNVVKDFIITTKLID